MNQDTLYAAQKAVIDAAKAMFAPFASPGQMFTIEHDAQTQEALGKAVRELQKAEGYFAGHPLTHEPDEAYCCRTCEASSTDLGFDIESGGVSHAGCGQCNGTDIQWYVVVPVDDHLQMETAKDALTKAMENYNAKS